MLGGKGVHPGGEELSPLCGPPCKWAYSAASGRDSQVCDTGSQQPVQEPWVPGDVGGAAQAARGVFT